MTMCRVLKQNIEMTAEIEQNYVWFASILCHGVKARKIPGSEKAISEG